MLKSFVLHPGFLKWAVALALIAFLTAIVLINYSSRTIRISAESRLYDSTTDIPERHVGLVLGCARILGNGRPNLYFSFRIDAAAELYHSGKCSYLVVSGDNSHENYDEPSDMAEALMEKGVPESMIYKDYAGFRTLDSVVRCKEIFGQTSITIVSQPFHNSRAIYIAKQNGIDAIGFNARKVDRYRAVKTKIREELAKVKTVLDAKVLGTEPKFLGPAIEIPAPSESS